MYLGQTERSKIARQALMKHIYYYIREEMPA